MPLVYSVKRLIIQFGFENALYRLELALASVGIIRLYISTDKQIMKLAMLLCCQFGYEVAIIPIKSVLIDQLMYYYSRPVKPSLRRG